MNILYQNTYLLSGSKQHLIIHLFYVMSEVYMVNIIPKTMNTTIIVINR